jgi:hypothetical protein
MLPMADRPDTVVPVIEPSRPSWPELDQNMSIRIFNMAIVWVTVTALLVEAL